MTDETTDEERQATGEYREKSRYSPREDRYRANSDGYGATDRTPMVDVIDDETGERYWTIHAAPSRSGLGREQAEGEAEAEIRRLVEAGPSPQRIVVGVTYAAVVEIDAYSAVEARLLVERLAADDVLAVAPTVDARVGVQVFPASEGGHPIGWDGDRFAAVRDDDPPLRLDRLVDGSVDRAFAVHDRTFGSVLSPAKAPSDG